MKKYFKMKYEQFLMGLFDKIMSLITNSDVDWYPEYVFKEEYCLDLIERQLESENEKLELKLWEREREYHKLFDDWMNKCELADNYYNALCKYEPWRLEE